LNNVAASAEPNCTEAIALTTRPAEGARASGLGPLADVADLAIGFDRNAGFGLGIDLLEE
jgi:hypothetical protein